MNRNRMYDLVEVIKWCIDNKEIYCLISVIIDIDIEIRDTIDTKPELSDDDEKFLCYIGEISDLIDDASYTAYWERLKLITDDYLNALEAFV